jgi:hypothetical protein
MWVLGGGQLPSRRFNEVWSSPDGSNWAPSLWSARSSHRVLAGLGNMWLMGGEDDDALPQSDVWESSDGMRWSLVKANAWPGRELFGAVAFHDQLWVMGGGTVSDVYFSPDGVVWTLATGAAAWAARDGFPVLSYHDTMWLLGGRKTGSIPANDVWWSVDGANWTQRTGSAGWSARYFHTALVFKDTMWVLGGTTGTNPLRDVWWSVDGANWTQRTGSAGWSARYLHASEVYDGKMWVLGGCNNSADFHDVWYSANGSTWTQATSGAEWAVRNALAALTYGDRLWVLGGYNSNSSTNDQDVWRYIGPPGIPILVTPDSGALDLPVNGLLRWNVESRSVSYDVYLDTLNPPVTLLAANQTGTVLPFSGLVSARTYYWKVIGKNVNGTTSSAVWNFLTLAGEPNWTMMSSLPDGGKLKAVKAGGALAYGKEAGNDTAFVYAFKGNGTYEFYRYNTSSNAWLALESINAYNRVSKKKAVKQGSSLRMAGDGKLYATKGNNSYDWWQYDPAKPWGSRWAQMDDVPTGNKPCREGVSSVAIEQGGVSYVYLLKGSGTYEFYRYNTLGGFWETVAVPPSGPRTKPYKKGSCIVYDGGDTIYCLKGTYDEFYAYTISGRYWQSRDTLPKGFFRKKAADGAAMACAGGTVYALKGNNCNEMWLYPTYTHAWQQGTSMTAGLRKVKAGGALVSVPDCHSLFAFRGNNTKEFWMYWPVASGYLLGAGRRNDEAQGQSAVRSPQFALSIAPNPFTSALNPSISYSLPVAGNVSLKLYDVTGKLVSTLVSGYRPAGSHSYSLLTTHYSLVRGVYLLELEACGMRVGRKLIIE